MADSEKDSNKEPNKGDRKSDRPESPESAGADIYIHDPNGLLQIAFPEPLYFHTTFPAARFPNANVSLHGPSSSNLNPSAAEFYPSTPPVRRAIRSRYRPIVIRQQEEIPEAANIIDDQKSAVEVSASQTEKAKSNLNINEEKTTATTDKTILHSSEDSTSSSHQLISTSSTQNITISASNSSDHLHIDTTITTTTTVTTTTVVYQQQPIVTSVVIYHMPIMPVLPFQQYYIINPPYLTMPYFTTPILPMATQLQHASQFPEICPPPQQALRNSPIIEEYPFDTPLSESSSPKKRLRQHILKKKSLSKHSSDKRTLSPHQKKSLSKNSSPKQSSSKYSSPRRSPTSSISPPSPTVPLFPLTPDNLPGGRVVFLFDQWTWKEMGSLEAANYIQLTLDELLMARARPRVRHPAGNTGIVRQISLISHGTQDSAMNISVGNNQPTISEIEPLIQEKCPSKNSSDEKQQKNSHSDKSVPVSVKGTKSSEKSDSSDSITKREQTTVGKNEKC